MKCPHCGYEREEDYKFCPMCGTNWYQPQAMSEEDTSEEAPENENQVKEEVFNRRMPYGLTEQTYNERNGIKKLARLSGGAFLLQSVIASVAVYVVLFALIKFGYSFDKAYDFLQDPFFSQYLQITISSLMFILPFTLFFKLGKYKISNLISFSLPKNKPWLPMILMGIGFCAFANIATSIAASFFEGLGINYEVDFGESPKGILGVTLSVIATAIVPALVEEFACRGILLGALRKYGDGFAIMISSITFGLMHGNFQQIPFAFMVGLILGYVTVKCESILPAMFIHFYNNLTSVIFEYTFMGVDIQLQNVIYTVYLSVALLIGIFGLLLLKNNGIALKLSPSDTEAGEKQKFKWFFLTEVIIFFVIICIADSLQFFIWS